MPCLIRKASRRAADCTSKKTTCFIYFTGSVVEIVLYLHFLYAKDDRLRLKRNMNRFSDNFLSLQKQSPEVLCNKRYF